MEPVKEWIPSQFIPCSPTHVMYFSVEPGTDLPQQFLCNFISQQAAHYNSDVRQCSLQQSDNEIQSNENATGVQLWLLQSAEYCSRNTSCNAAVLNDDDDDDVDKDGDDDDGDDNNYDDNDVDDEVDDDDDDDDEERRKDSSHGVDLKAISLTTGNDGTGETHSVDTDKQTDSLPSETNLALKTPLIENWLANSHKSNTNNACVYEDCKLNRDAPVLNSVIESNRYSSMPRNSSGNINMSKQIQGDQLDMSNVHAVNSQPHCSQCLLELLTAVVRDHQPDDMPVKQQLKKSKTRNVSIAFPESETNHTMKNSTEKSAASLGNKNTWQVTNVSQRCSLFEYKQQILNRQVSVRGKNVLQQAYCHISERWGLTFVRHIRGDSFAAVRAILYQALVHNFLQASNIGKLQDSCEKLQRVFADARNRFLFGWNFANRIPYDKGKEVEVLSDCLKKLHDVVEMMSCVPSRMCREDYLMCFLNHNPDADIRLLESVKFLMMERALCVYRHNQWRKLCNYPLPAEFWLFASLCPERLFRQRINPLGDSVMAEQMEFQLMGYALGIQIEIIRPAAFCCCDCSCDFVTRYLCEGFRISENLCVVIEEDNEYCVLTA